MLRLTRSQIRIAALRESSESKGFFSGLTLLSLFAPRVFHNAFAIKRFHTLSKKCRVSPPPEHLFLKYCFSFFSGNSSLGLLLTFQPANLPTFQPRPHLLGALTPSFPFNLKPSTFNLRLLVLNGTDVRPAGVLVLYVQDEVFDLERKLVGVAIRTSASVREPLHAAFLITIEDLVTGLAGDTELPAKFRHRLAG